jgi:hypothetical protein
MKTLPPLPARRRSLDRAWRAAGAAGFTAALVLSLAACKGDDDVPMSLAGAALVASAPAVAATHVPPPPTIQAIVTSQTTPAAATPAASELASVRTQLESTLAGASACHVDTDCHSVAVGAKSCGGPTGYRAFSTQGTDAVKVTDLAQHERELSATVARESHQVSPCFMLADPGAHCQQNRCTTGPAATN